MNRPGTIQALNQILWLKCRLSERAFQTGHGSWLGTGLVVLITFLFSVPCAAFLGYTLGSLTEVRSGEFLHLTLTFVYGFWLTFPILGYRVSEAFDPSRLFIFPVSSFTLMSGCCLANLLDISAFLVYPFLIAIALSVAGLGPGLLPAILILLTFLVHTLGASQMLVSLLIDSLRDRRIMDRLMVVLPLLMALAIWSVQFVFIFSAQGGNLLDMRPSTVTAWIPPGIAAQALMSLRADDLPGALYWGIVMLVLDVLTIAIMARSSDWIRTRGSTSRATHTQRTSSRLSRVLFSAASFLARGPAVPAMVVKELRLLAREPQVRLIAAFFLLVFGGFSAAGLALIPTSEGVSMLPMLSVSAGLFFVGLLFNCFALDREGLPLMVLTPVARVTHFVGKNIAYWLYVAILQSTVLLILALVLGVSMGLVLQYVLVGLVLLVLMTGVGNVISVLAPYRFISRSTMQAQRLPFGKALLYGILGILGSGLTVLLATIAFLMLAPPLLSGAWSGLLESIPLAACFTLGTYALLTLVAAGLFEWRLETLIAELAE